MIPKVSKNITKENITTNNKEKKENFRRVNNSWINIKSLINNQITICKNPFSNFSRTIQGSCNNWKYSSHIGEDLVQTDYYERNEKIVFA